MKLLHTSDIENFPAFDRPDDAENLTVVGLVQLADKGPWLPLAIKQEGRFRYLHVIEEGVSRPIEDENAGHEFYDALDAACSSLWQHNWNAMLGRIFGFNRRSLQRDRVSKFLLPGPVVEMIAFIYTIDDAQEFGDFLAAIAQYEDRYRHEGMVRERVNYALDLFFSPRNKRIFRPHDEE